MKRTSRLQRFIDAQEPVFDTVLEELRTGKKKTHWMWFVFPQIVGLGHSPMSLMYGLTDLSEAVEYLDHPLLGPRLHECFSLVLEHQDRSAQDIFGQIDALKLQSCATLFDRAQISRTSIFKHALAVFFDGQVDRLTCDLL